MCSSDLTVRGTINTVGNAVGVEGNLVEPGKVGDTQTSNTKVNETLNAGNTNQPTTTNNPKTTTNESKIQMNITLDAPTHIDTAQLQKVLNDPIFQQELIKAINTAQTNNGQTMYGNPNEKK